MASIHSIWQDQDQTLAIEWQDGRTDRFTTQILRQSCPCAVCLVTHPSKDVTQNALPKTISSVGSYALTIEFQDGHKSGIYSFDYLRSLACPTSL